ncbi:MAG TPA: tail fiber domain-containing protein [Chitinophagaceae bacterium]
MSKILLRVSSFTAIATYLFTASLYAQNTAPYWSLKGNSNATTTSKLGTTNSIPVGIFTNNKLRMFISQAGTVNIGNNNASTNGYQLYVKGATNGIYGTGTSYGIYGDGGSYGLYGNSVNGFGGIAISTNSDGFDAYTTKGYYGIYASCGSYTGVYGYGGTTGTYGYGGTYGINGYSSGGYGVYGNSYNGYGVYGTTTSGYSAGYFHSVNGYGLGAASDKAAYAAVFFGGVYSNTGFFTSDRNLKKNIEDFSSAMSIINRLKPKYYEFKTDAKYAGLHLPDGKHYGLLAQDLEQVLPNLVHEENFHIPVSNDDVVLQPKTADGKDINQYGKNTQSNKTEDINVKAVNYTELIPIMVKGMQEQNKIIQEQNDKIELLTQKLNTIANNNSINIKLANAYLDQSIPNPVKNAAVINYNNIPANANARLMIYDATGKLLKQITLNKSGSGSVNVDVSSLGAGIYSYSLMLNNKLADTKTMEVAR